MDTVVGRQLAAASGPLIAAAAVALSAWFAATAAARLGAPDEPPTAAVVAVVPRSLPPVVAVSGAAGEALITRNMFCSSCVPPIGRGPEPPPAVTTHALPRLIATHVGAAGWATLEAGGVAGAFAVGAVLPGGGVIHVIESGAIVMRFGDATTTRVVLASDAAAAGVGAVAVGAAGATGAASDPWADRIRVVGDHRWEVDRALIRELVQAGTGQAAARGVRLAPVNKDGKLAGVRVSAARPGSLARALGLDTGDVIDTIDGRAIDSPEVLMDMYNRLGDLRRVDLGVRGKGGARSLTYDLP